MSLGSAKASHTVKAAIDFAQENGTLVIAASGNAQSAEPFYPAAYDGVIAVGATRMNNELWSLSNHGNYITVVAPGDTIFSTAPNSSSSQLELGSQSGTSMAAPYVAGLAGLLLSQDPNRTHEDLTRIIARTATDLGDAGADDQFGNGLINVLEALNHVDASGEIQGVSQPSEIQLHIPFVVQD